MCQQREEAMLFLLCHLHTAFVHEGDLALVRWRALLDIHAVPILIHNYIR